LKDSERIVNGLAIFRDGRKTAVGLAMISACLKVNFYAGRRAEDNIQIWPQTSTGVGAGAGVELVFVVFGGLNKLRLAGASPQAKVSTITAFSPTITVDFWMTVASAQVVASLRAVR
jgi:hypothetical protein